MTKNEKTAGKLVKEHYDFMRAMGFKWATKLAWRFRRSNLDRDTMDEVMQEAIARTYTQLAAGKISQFAGLTDDETRKRLAGYIINCLMNALVGKSTLGHPKPNCGYQDCMDHANCVWDVSEAWSLEYNDDGEADYVQRADPIERPERRVMGTGVARWELERICDREQIPKKLRLTAIYAALDLTQEDSAALQRCSDRTIRNRLQQLREWLDPSDPLESPYQCVGEALYECLLCSE